MKKVLLFLLPFFLFLVPTSIYAQVHERPVTTATLSPSATPDSPGSGLTFYSDPVTVTLNATADTGYSIAHTYYKVDGGSQSDYSGNFTVSGIGKHFIEYWSIDNTGIEELSHRSINFTIGYQDGQIVSMAQNGNNMDITVHLNNTQPYLDYIHAATGVDGCWNDNGLAFEIYNATTGARVSSYSGSGGFHCGDASDGNFWLAFPPLQLPSGTYFIHYSGGTFDWITEDFVYTAPVPHNHPTSTITLSQTPISPGSGLSFYSDPVTVTLDATADAGYSIAQIYYKVDGGAQQTYSEPFIVSGVRKHTVEYWSVDNVGLQEVSHKSKSFTVGYQHSVINSIVKNGNNMDITVHLDNIQPYLDYIHAATGVDGCWNDNGLAFEIYNATTGARISSYSGSGGFHCGNDNDGNAWLAFPPFQLDSGTYFIHYSGGPFDWVTEDFVYTAPAPVHDNPVTVDSLSPAPSSPGQGLTIYSDPVTVTLNATPANGYSITNTYYKIDGGTQQIYTEPFTVSSVGKHAIEYWSVDNTNLEETVHRHKNFTIGYQHAVINYIEQNGINIDLGVHLDNIQPYLDYIHATTGVDGCWNDNGLAFEIYNASTGARVSSYSGSGGFHCGSDNDGNAWLAFPPLLLPAGTYFVHYSGGNFDWITENFNYQPTPKTTISLATQNEDSTYSNPTTVTLSATAAVGTLLADTYYKVDGGAQQTYTGPFTVLGGGDHAIEYWSADTTGVQEVHKTKSFTIYLNQAPVVDPFAGATINTGQTFAATSSFTDPDSASWTATVDYGDIGGGPESLSLNGPNFSLSHQYSTAGTYTVSVVITDASQNTGTTTATVVVENPLQKVGFTDQGASLDSSNANFMNGTKFTVGSVGGSASSMSVYVGAVGNSPNNQYQMAIYTNKTNGKPGTLVAQTSSGTLAANSWNSLPITATLNANTTYWLMYNTNAAQSTLNNMYYSNDEPSIGAFSGRTYGTWPANYPNNPTMTTQKFSIYVSYLPSGPIPPAPTVLVGNNNVESNLDSNNAGSAEAFQYTALSTGSASKLDVYLNGNNQASTVRVGVYTDNNNNPGTLLSQAVIASPINGAWNTVTIPATSITSGTKYWIAILSPQGNGTARFRDKASGGPASVSSNQSNLTTLPTTWTTGQTWTTTALSAFVY